MAQTTTTIELTYEVQEQVRLAKTELGEMLAGQGNIVRRIGDALRKDPSVAENPERICVTIKQLLAAEIEQGVISHRTIEDACPPEWKNQVQSRAGAKGAAKTAANARAEKAESESAPAVSASAFEELTAKVNRIEEKFGSLKSAAEKLVDGAKREGDSVRVPLDLFTALVDEVKG